MTNETSLGEVGRMESTARVTGDLKQEEGPLTL